MRIKLKKLFDQISFDDLKIEFGLNILIGCLDKHLSKDDLADSVETFDDFDDFRRKDGQTIQKKEMKFPSEILAFKLLKRANITKEERLLVLTGTDYEKKSTLYEEAKKSLKKFKGDDNVQSEKSIKLEAAYKAENEEILLAAGYVKAKSSNSFNYRRGSRWDRGHSSRGDPDSF